MEVLVVLLTLVETLGALEEDEVKDVVTDAEAEETDEAEVEAAEVADEEVPPLIVNCLL